MTSTAFPLFPVLALQGGAAPAAAPTGEAAASGEAVPTGGAAPTGTATTGAVGGKAEGAQAPAADNSPFNLPFLIPAALFLVIWWFVLMRPQQQDRKKRQVLLDSLKKNDRVVTNSGMIGTVANISGDGKEITLKFGENVRIPFLRSAVERVLSEPATPPTT